MTEEQSQSTHYSRQISDDSVGTTSLIKLLMVPDNEKKTVVTSSRYSKILAVIAMLVIIAMILSTAAIIASKNKQGNIIFTNF